MFRFDKKCCLHYYGHLFENREITEVAVFLLFLIESRLYIFYPSLVATQRVPLLEIRESDWFLSCFLFKGAVSRDVLYVFV